MTAKSILNMNWTRGNRELETATELTPLEVIAVRVSLAYELQSSKQDEQTRRVGNNIEADALHQLIEHVNTEPRHFLNAEQFPFDELSRELAPKVIRQSGTLPQLPPARMIVTKSFVERWTDNPDHYREHFGIDDVELNGQVSEQTERPF